MVSLIPIRDHNPYSRFPLVTVAVIALNVWVFFTQGPVDDVTAFQYGAVPCDLVGRCDRLSGQLAERFPERVALLTLVTSMFLHGSFAHLAGNLLYLWVFGNNVEDRLGHVRYAVFYIVCGLAGSIAHVASQSGSPVPVVGASGAISGVLGAYLVLFPRARVLSVVPFLFFLPLEVSAGVLLGLWFLMQLLGGLAGLGATQGSGVAFLAHVGGFAAGWAIVRAVAPPRRRVDPIDRWLGPG